MYGKKIRFAALAALGLGLFVSARSASAAILTLDDVTTPGDPITAVNGSNDSDTAAGPPASPVAEDVTHAIDNNTNKYLNFLDYNSGFIVSPTRGAGGAGTIVRAVRLYTAGDAPDRDPASFILEGAQSANGPFTVIYGSDVTLPGDRNAGGAVINPNIQNFATVAFNNTTAYKTYRLTFPTLRNGVGANSMQIGEVELLGTVVPEPGTLSVLALGAAGLLARRRRA